MVTAACRALALFWMLALCLAAPQAAAGAPYRLGAQDHLQVRVYDWRTGTGEVHEWTALNDEFIVGASGTVALPLVGEVEAAGLTTAALSDAIAQRLQAKVGLSQRPDASVEVIRYRPFYILGAVDKPGEYEYRPDLTVLQAVGTAGGLSRVSDQNLLGFERDAITNRGELRELAAEHDGLLARQARLDAEIKGLDAIAFPPAMTAPSASPDARRTVREEQLLFDVHRDALKSQIDALDSTRSLLTSEVKSLGEKDASLAHQLDITKKELAQITGLVSKGLTVLPRQLEAEQSTAQFESNRLDVQIAKLRAQQDISKTERDALDLQNTRRTEALKEAGDVHVRLAALDEKIETAQRLIVQAEVRAPQSLASTLAARAQPPSYAITRQVDGKPETMAASESDPVQPGDTVRVEIQADPLGPATAATHSASTD